MKILLVADLHYTLPQWDWLSATAERFDLVVVAGDLLEISSIVPMEAQIVVIRKYLEKVSAKVPLLVSSGNHDVVGSDPSARTAAWLKDKQAATHYADGEFYESEHYYFSILQWWENDAEREQTLEQLAAQAKMAAGKKWIWVYHPPPAGSSTAWDGKKDYGDRYLPAWIRDYKPYMILGGHIHNAPYHLDGSWVDCIDGSWIFNGGRQIGGIPTFTVLEMDNERAVWISSEEVEQVMLREPLQREQLN